MKSFYSVSLCAYQVILMSYYAYACDNDVHWKNATSTADSTNESFLVGEKIDRRYLSGQIVEECGFLPLSTEEMEEDAINMNAWIAKQKTLSVSARSGTIYTIPVYFHVIQTSRSSGIVSDARIGEYISYLNDAFTGSSVPFTFVSKGVTRTIQSDWGECNDYETEIAIKEELKVGGADTLNVYICNPMFTSKGASVTGFATSPYAKSGTDIRDGVVIDNSSSIGRLNTLVHEVGHFLGLLHTFGDNTCNADSKGDLVADTPQHISRASTVNCNSDPSSWDTCPLLPGIDPVDNYMTYTNNNICRTRFTSGQSKRMLAQYELYRLPKNPVPAPKPAAPRPTPLPPRPAPRPAPVATRPVPRPTPVAARPVQRPTPIASQPAPRPTPVATRPTPIASQPVPTVPRPTPIAPRPAVQRPSLFSPRPPTQPVPFAPRQPIFAPRGARQPTLKMSPTASCAAISEKCSDTIICCSGFCQSSLGIFSRIFGSRCV